MYVFAYPWKEFRDPGGKKTNIFKAAVDAFNIFDLFIEVWHNFRWLFVAIVLRRPYPKDPYTERMDLFGAMTGARNTAGYGKADQESYAMLSVPNAPEPPPLEMDDEAAGGYPTSLRPARGKFSDGENDEELKPSPTRSDPPAYQAESTDTGYTNTYGQDRKQYV